MRSAERAGFALRWTSCGRPSGTRWCSATRAALAYREIGEVCGIDEAAARKRVSRALGRLRVLLKDDGDAY